MLTRKTLMVALAGVLGTGIGGTAMADSAKTVDQQLNAGKLDQNYEKPKSDQIIGSDQQTGSDQKLDVRHFDQNYERAGSNATTSAMPDAQSSKSSLATGSNDATPVYGETMVLIVPDQPSANGATSNGERGAASSGSAAAGARPDDAASTVQGSDAGSAPVQAYYRRETVILVPQPDQAAGAAAREAGNAGAAGLDGSTEAGNSSSAGAEPALGPTTQYGAQGTSSADSATLYGKTSTGGSSAPPATGPSEQPTTGK